MIWTLAKWGIGLPVLVAAILALTGRKEFHVEIFIPAAPDAVWAVLTDANGYAEWNPVFVQVVGEFRQDSSVETTVREPGKQDIVIKSQVLKVSRNRELNQVGGIRGLITFDHKWLLEPTDEGTKVTQHEVDRGLWVWFWNSDWVEPAYQQTNEALRARVMSLRAS